MNRILLTAVLCTGMFGFASAAAAATRYWVGGCSTNNWNCSDVGGVTNWGSASNTRDNASIPASTDDVIFDGIGFGTGSSTVSNSPTIKSLNMSGYSGMLTIGASQNLIISGVGSPVTFGTGMTIVKGSSGSSINFQAASGTTTVTTNGVVLPNVVFNGASANFVLADPLLSSSTITATAGSVHFDGANDNSGFNIYIGALSQGGTVYLGNATVNLTTNSTTVFNKTGGTLIAGNSTINIIGVGSASFNGGGATFNNVVFNGPNISPGISGANTFNNLSFIGPANKTTILTVAANQTINNALTLAGNSSTNRFLFASNTLGTPLTITVNGSVAASNVDFRDITGAGTASWDLSAISGGSGNSLGNTGITFTPSQTNYWVGNTGNWSDSTHWANVSGGTGGTGRVPLPQDDARFDANSFTTTGQRVTVEMPRIGRNVDWTGVTNNPAFGTSFGFSTYTQYGSLTMNSGMTLPFVAGSGWTFEGRGSYTLTTGGHWFPSYSPTIQMIGGTLTLLDSWTGINVLTVNNGTFNANGFNISANLIDFHTSTASRIINMGSGTWTVLSDSFTGWNASVTTNLTINPQTSTIVMAANGSGTKTFNGGGLTYNNLSIVGGGSGPVSIVGSNIFNRITINKPKTVIFTANTTNTFNQFIAKGTSGNLITLQSSTPGTKYTLKQTSGFVSSDWMSITDSTATGGAQWFAGTNSTLSNSTGWQLLTGPAQRGLTLQNGKIKIQKGKVKFQFR